MSVDDTKLAFYSEWDIDQLIATAEVPVTLVATSLYTYTTSDAPYFEVQFKPTGSTQWFQCGVNSLAGTLAGVFSFKAYISSTSIYIDVDAGGTAITGGTARYFIWADKVIQ